MTAAKPSELARLRLPQTAVQVRSWAAVPIALYVVAFLVGLGAAATIVFPTNEGSAYYVAVARNLAAGRGLVIDTIWSYATPPLVIPRPAFELWQPLASLIAAIPMTLTGTGYHVAQLGGVIVGAAVAPLAWAVTRDAAKRLEVPSQRVAHLAVGSGILAAVSAPIVLAVAVPDSTLPFLVFGAACCWLAPRALAGGRLAALALGVALGLAYLSRHEAVYIALVVFVAAIAARPGLRKLADTIGPVIIGGGLVVAPWLARNVAVFGTPLPGQALDNALLTSNEQIFAYGARPSVGAFLDQGTAQILANIVSGSAHNIVDVLLLSAMPVGLIGIVGIIALARRPGLRGSALWFLLVSGALTLAIDSVIFPVASMWGTFLHAAGPLLMGLIVAAVLVGDRFVDGVRRRRSWSRANAWLAPLALVLVAVPMTLLQLVALGGGVASQQRYTNLATIVEAQPEYAAAGGRPVVISDHPLWLNTVSALPTLALPAQPPEVVLKLAHDQGATLIAVGESRGEYPAAFRSGALSRCFDERPLPAGAPAGAAVFAIDPSCR